MARTYVVRAGQRISIHCPFLYHGENFHGKGTSGICRHPAGEPRETTRSHRV